MTSGYSGTPLAKKLTLKPGITVWWPDMSASVRAEIGDVGVLEQAAPTPGLDAAHLFVTERADLERHLAKLRHTIAPAGFVWVS